MGSGIDLRARSTKGRGLFRKAPDPKEVADRVGRLLRRVVKDGVTRTGWKGDRFIAELRALSSIQPLTLSVEPDAELALTGDALAIGPGYCADLIARLAPLLDELDYAWTASPTLAALQRQLCEGVAAALRSGATKIGIPAARAFRIDAPVLTALGPRDAAWHDAVLADPARASDAFAWWDVGPGRAERARALLAMWHEVPWREPIDAEERDLMERVDTDLRAAREADPALDLPRAAWRDLLEHLGIADDDVTARAAGERASLGYRRHDLDVELSGGWVVTQPGAMVGHWEDDGERYWATDGDRLIEFSSLTAPGETDSARLLAVAPEQHEVIARHEAGTLRGRAEAFDDNAVHVVVGLMAQAPHVGILTCRGGTEAWALATWRSLRQVG
jgi:hypothetical protein